MYTYVYVYKTDNNKNSSVYAINVMPAACQSSAEQFIEARVAVRFVVPLLERALVQRANTERADEVFRMIFLVQCCHTATGDQLTARGTWHPALGEKVPLTVHGTIQFVESRTIKWQTTFLHIQDTVVKRYFVGTSTPSRNIIMGSSAHFCSGGLEPTVCIHSMSWAVDHTSSTTCCTPVT